jgi:hypothetical protein
VHYIEEKEGTGVDPATYAAFTTMVRASNIAAVLMPVPGAP